MLRERGKRVDNLSRRLSYSVPNAQLYHGTARNRHSIPKFEHYPEISKCRNSIGAHFGLGVLFIPMLLWIVGDLATTGLHALPKMFAKSLHHMKTLIENEAPYENFDRISDLQLSDLQAKYAEKSRRILIEDSLNLSNIQNEMRADQ